MHKLALAMLVGVGVALTFSTSVLLGKTAYPTRDTLPAGIFLEELGRATLPAGVELRIVYPKGLQVTKRSEGFVPYLYNDAADYCTIGYGHLLRKAPCDGSEPREFQAGISERRGTVLLTSDMEQAQINVMLLTSQLSLTNGEYASLCDFAFNVGVNNLKNSTLLKAINAKRLDRVPAQFRRWVMAGGKEIRGLKTRREQEIVLFFDGMAIPRGAPPAGENISPIDIRAGE